MNKQQLASKIWESANKMRSKIEAFTEADTDAVKVKNFDNLITLHQRKLEKLQNIKKSMLAKMFV